MYSLRIHQIVITSYVICVFKMKMMWGLSACRKASFGTFAAAASVRLLRASLYFIMGRGIWAREVFRHATSALISNHIRNNQGNGG